MKMTWIEADRAARAYGVRFVKTDARSFNHSADDKKAPQAYRVFVGSTEVGRVDSHSEGSWLKDSAGIRYAFRGFRRTWIGTDPAGKEGYTCYNRTDAARGLVATWLMAKAAEGNDR